ncbi:MAG: M20 family metallo-hydrolase [Rikenellaceae bacterium]
MEFKEKLYKESVELLKNLVSTPSPSREEVETADLIEIFLQSHGIKDIHRHVNNVWVYNLHFDSSKPTILLNSHHDTVRPNSAYTRNPFEPTIEDGKLYGLGSNDAGASVVSLISAFLWFYKRENLKYNLCLAITAEEEVSGANGIEKVLPMFGEIDFAIVGEPTDMNLAIAERGLMVVDCKSVGKAGHAARNEGENAIYKALKNIEWFKNYRFDKVSELFGEQKMNVTMINAGSQHNVVPAECSFVVDIRIIDKYSHQEIVDIIRQHVDCEVKPRSFRLTPSSISTLHPIVVAGIELGCKTFGSPTSSDQALMKFTSVKIGVGDSARSHSADEFVYLAEIEHGIELYIKLLEKIV